MHMQCVCPVNVHVDIAVTCSTCIDAAVKFYANGLK